MQGKLGRATAVGVALLVAAITASSCSSSSKTATPSTQSGSSGSVASVPVQGISGHTIKVGGVFDGTAFLGADVGFKARVQRANRTKELGSYTIDDIGSTNVGTDVSTTTSAVQSLVERDQVFAVAPVVTTGLQQNGATYLASKHVPYFGTGFTAAYCSPNTYGVSILACAVQAKFVYTTAVTNMAEAVSKALNKPVKQLKWAFVGYATPDGQIVAQQYAKQVQLSGVGTVVYAKGVIPQASGADLQPIVTSVTQTQPDIAFSLAGPGGIPFSVAMKQAGYKGALADPNFYAPHLLQQSPAIAQTLDGEFVQTTTPAPLEEGQPFLNQMLQDYKGIGNPAITLGGEWGYQSADLMIAALKKVAPNFGTLIPTLEKSFTYTPLKGGTPISWPEAYDTNTACGGTVRITGKVYQVLIPFNCNGKRVALK